MAAGTEVRGHPSQARRRRFTGGREVGPEPEVIEEDAPPVYVNRGWLADSPDPADEASGDDDGQADDDGGPGLTKRAARRAGLAGRRQFRATSRVLVVEFVLAMALVVLKPSEPAPAADGTTKASEATIPQLASVMVVFLLLAALGSAGPRPQRVANLFGGLVCLVLAFKNHGNVAAAITSLSAQTLPAPNMAPDIGNLPLPTSGNNPYPGGISGRDEQTTISGWRGSVPMTSATNPYPGGISGRA